MNDEKNGNVCNHNARWFLEQKAVKDMELGVYGCFRICAE